MDLRRSWLVLNEFNQMIAKDHFAGGDGDRLADSKLIGSRRPLPRTQALQIIHEIPEAVDEIETALCLCSDKDVGVRQREIRRRDDIERLSHQEIEPLGIFLVHPALERAIGVIYRPESELASHYFEAILPRQFDEYIWIDRTTAIKPLHVTEVEEMPETYPFGL